MGENLKYTEEDIAFVVHEANRAVQALHGDDVPSLPWLWEGREQRAVTMAGVRRVLTGVTPEQNQEAWCADKRAQGWTYGPEKDIDRKTHPCLVPLAELPRQERVKVRVFYALVHALAEEL